MEGKQSLNPGALITVLLDPTAPYGDRIDAAMDLAGFEGIEVERALGLMARASATEPDLAQWSAESLAEIWSRGVKPDMDILGELQGEARNVALALLARKRPEWSAFLPK